MQQVSDARMTPIKGAIIGLALDAKMQGTVLAQEVMAEVKAEHGRWVKFAHRVFGMTPDARDAFVAAVKGQVKEIYGNVMEIHGMSKKDAGKEIRSSIVQVSRLVKIAQAANKGASMAGLGAFYGVKDPEHVGYNRVYTYAVAVMKAEVANKGRPVSPIVVKLSKWLAATVESQGKAERTAEVEALDDATVAEVQRIIAKLQPKTAE